MSEPTDTDRSARHEKLLKEKLDSLLDWQVPQIEETVGPFDPEAFDVFDAERNRLRAACEEKLLACSDQEIAHLLDSRTDETDETRQNWRHFLSREIRTLKERKPPWFAGGFGHPEYAATFENWCKMPAFSIKETLCLSVGFDPRHLPKGSLNDVLKDSPPFLEELSGFLIARFELLKRQFDPDNLDQRVRPARLLAWASQVHLELHPEFERLLRKYHLPESTGPDQNSSAMPDTRETRTIAGLFTLLAMDHLGYDPESKRSPIPKEIVDLAASKGVSVSEDTVRKYLRIGAEKIRKDGQEE